MKSTIGFTIVLAACVALCGNTTLAQMNQQGHMFTVTTFHGIIPEGGSAAERDSLLSRLDALTKMNPKYLSSRTLRHHWGHNNQDWVIITEYANWDDIESSGKIDEENFKKTWPKDDFVKLNRDFNRYFPTHSDEIYSELSKYTK